MDTLDLYYHRDLAFLRDPNCWGKQEGFCDISFTESSERAELLGSSFPEELLPEQLPESDPDEPNEESDDWWELLSTVGFKTSKDCRVITVGAN